MNGDPGRRWLGLGAVFVGLLAALVLVVLPVFGLGSFATPLIGVSLVLIGAVLLLAGAFHDRIRGTVRIREVEIPIERPDDTARR